MQFHLPTKIIFQPDSITKAKEIVEEHFKAVNPLLITDQGLRESGVAEKVLSQFDTMEVFDAVEANPKAPTVNRTGDLAREMDADLVIGLGGGSSMDTAKATALLATNEGDIEEYEGQQQYQNPPLPVLTIPTTCGTGSEVTWVAVITDPDRKFKMSIKGPEVFPSVALIDPNLLSTLPSSLIASTGMDALTHAIEAYTVKPRTVITDLFAQKAIKLIFNSLEAAYQDIKEHEEARERMMLASTLAGIAFGNSDVGAVHCIAESVGGLYDIPHGIANSIFLPYVMEFNLPVVKERYAKIARFIGIKEQNDRNTAEKLIQRVKAMAEVVNIPSFKELDIKQSAFPKIAEKSVRNNSNPSNPREASKKDYLGILNAALHSNS